MKLPLTRLVTASFFLLIIISIQVSGVHGQTGPIIDGAVRDEGGAPLTGALIVILNQRGIIVDRTMTDSEGVFNVTMDEEGSYYIYALADRPDTMGIDYVPSLWNTYAQAGSRSSYMFVLRKGASLYVEGNVRFIESTEMADYRLFTVESLSEPLADNLVTTYGSRTDLVARLGFDERLVVIPADAEVTVSIFAQNSRTRLSDTFQIKGEPGYFKISQGEVLRVDVSDFSLRSNLERLKLMMDSAFSLLKEADDAGFLVNVERKDLLDAYSEADSSLASMKVKLYDESFAKMRGAYILTAKTTDYLRSLLQISSQSALALPLFFMFVASGLAYLIADRESCVEMFMRGKKKLSFSINVLITLGFYLALLSVFYFLYPGSRVTAQASFVMLAVFALVIWQIVAVVSRRVSSEKRSEPRSIQFRSAIVIAFSMALRNLRRRKLRTVLNLTNMIVLIFGLITMTSISPGYGLIKQSLRPAIPVDALLIRWVPVGSSLSFLSIPSSFVTWLESQEDVTIVSPKAENIPLEEPIGYLYTKPGEQIPVQGVIGISACNESRFTATYKIIVEGSYLSPEDYSGILVSSTFRKILKVGEKLYGFGKEFVVRGFFDPVLLEKLVDVDGQLFIPKRLDPRAGPVPISGDQSVILHYDIAIALPNIVISRVNVQLKDADAELYLKFAEMVTLIMEYRVYISHPDSLQLQLLGTFVEEVGAGLIPFLMFLVILNVSASMLSTVAERRNEIATLSSVGLNPTHVVALFMAEAAVVGLIGGGLGYLLGILGYRLVANSFLGVLQIREKASVEWGIMALALSVSTAILASVIPSIRASTIATPSLMRRWRLGEKEKLGKTGQPWLVDLPVKIVPRELEVFTGFMVERLKGAEFVGEVKLEERGASKKIGFKYFDRATLVVGSINEIVIEPTPEDYFAVRLRSIPVGAKREGIVHEAATDVRGMVFEWNARTFEVATPFDPSLSQLYTLVVTYNPTTLYILATEYDVEKKMDPLRLRLLSEGFRPPKVFVSKVGPTDMEQIMRASEDLVSRADVICVSGEPAALSTALALYAAKKGKRSCYVVDTRPPQERLRKPYESLKIVNVT